MIKLISVSDQQIEELMALAKRTFTEAFEEQNSPENFNLYMRQAFNRTVLLEHLQHDDIRYFFISRGQQTVGYIKINENTAQSEQFDLTSIELERFYVQSEYQGQNIGAEVLKKIVRMAKDKGVAFLWLGVWEKNDKAIRFYERHGFKKFGAHPYFLGNDKQTDYLMKLDLTPPLPF